MADIQDLRDKQDDHTDQIAKIWTALRETQTVLWGDAVLRNNGIRSEVKGLNGELEAIHIAVQAHIEKARRFADKERFESCPVIKELQEHIKDHEEQEEKLYEEGSAVRVAEIQADAARAGAMAAIEAARVNGFWKALGQIVVQGLVTAGLLYLAFTQGGIVQ